MSVEDIEALEVYRDSLIESLNLGVVRTESMTIPDQDRASIIIVNEYDGSMPKLKSRHKIFYRDGNIVHEEC